MADMETFVQNTTTTNLGDVDDAGHGDNTAVAFGLVTMAGLSTCLGAAVVFVPRLAKFATPKFLAGGVAFSAGVMLYVSFVEIFQKAVLSFQDAGHEAKFAYTFASTSFFAGIAFMLLLHKAVHFITDYAHSKEDLASPSHSHTTVISNGSGSSNSRDSNNSDGKDRKHACAAGLCISDSPEIFNTLNMISYLDEKAKELGMDTWDDVPPPESAKKKLPATHRIKPERGDEPDPETALPVESEAERQKRLMHMSLQTALAIGLHNFPEGLATFVAALNDPKIGTVLAVAVAIHNIPEGLCVALPVYYATRSKWRAFGWALLSGISEPLAALVGWLVLGDSISHSMYGAMFGVVAGMMVTISVRELLPTAHKYDPTDSVTTFALISGMGIMALSLVLFLL